MNIKASIFDMDGLLIDSETIALEQFQIICNRYDMGEQFDLYRQLLGTNTKTTRLILDQTLSDAVNTEQFMAEWTENYVAATRDGVPLLPGVLGLLDLLDEYNIPMSVATSTHTNPAIEKLEKSGILHRFQHITGGDQISNGKPAPDIFLKAADRMAVSPRFCLAFEDSPNGVKAALAAGMQVIQVPSLVEPDDALRSMGHCIMNNLDEAVVHIRNSII